MTKRNEEKKACRFSEAGAVTRLDLGGGEWAEIPEVIDFEKAQAIATSGDNAVTLAETVTAWSLKARDGSDAPVTAEMMRKLDVMTFQIINNAVVEKITLPKE